MICVHSVVVYTNLTGKEPRRQVSIDVVIVDPGMVAGCVQVSLKAQCLLWGLHRHHHNTGAVTWICEPTLNMCM